MKGEIINETTPVGRVYRNKIIEKEPNSKVVEEQYMQQERNLSLVLCITANYHSFDSEAATIAHNLIELMTNYYAV
ncbi:Hypothetical protein CINCED_3A005769 [Cinara cedri]|uniref:Uncharacterized protein n=1 Tax=Cinara cedri TaxID=506608 RepID=A0A5E4MZL2_9HEMI|nr:Hypothetical protein CINCED_3A005769 [Cinara cedri]